MILAKNILRLSRGVDEKNLGQHKGQLCVPHISNFEIHAPKSSHIGSRFFGVLLFRSKKTVITA
jgi:hypothetical protein